MTRFTVRDAVSADENSVREIVEAVLREFDLPYEPAGRDADLSDFMAQYQARGGIFRVVIDEAGEIVGCGGVFPLDEHTAEIRKMYILPRARGLGHGREILADLIAHARGRGFDELVLETLSRLPAAAAHLYRQAGFVDVPHPHPSVRSDRAMKLKTTLSVFEASHERPLKEDLCTDTHGRGPPQHTSR